MEIKYNLMVKNSFFPACNTESQAHNNAALTAWIHNAVSRASLGWLAKRLLRLWLRRADPLRNSGKGHGFSF